MIDCEVLFPGGGGSGASGTAESGTMHDQTNLGWCSRSALAIAVRQGKVFGGF